MSDDKATIDRQAAQIAMLREALEAFDKSAKESASIIGFAGKALKLLQQARAALTATAADVEAWAKAEGLSLKDFYVGTPDDPAYNKYTTFLAWEAWQAAQAAPVEPCCGDYFNCQRPCTPRGRELEKREHTTPPAEGVPTNGTVIELAAKTAEVERLRKDAERYRWLRHGDNDELVLVTYERPTEMAPPAYLPRNEELDAAIDAAMETP